MVKGTVETVGSVVEVDSKTVITEIKVAIETKVVTESEVVIVNLAVAEAVAPEIKNLKFQLLMRAKLPRCSQTTFVLKPRHLRKLFISTR
jgi:hypothetical protein